jgi:hypothetical protein
MIAADRANGRRSTVNSCVGEPGGPAAKAQSSAPIHTPHNPKASAMKIIEFENSEELIGFSDPACFNHNPS